MTEEIIDLIEENATPIVNEMEIEITESIGWAAADTNMHSNLPDRNAPNQHLTSAITGLDEQLAQIKAPRVLYSDKKGVANYYKWANDFRYNDAGYFVSLVPKTSTIKICEGSDIFGVTVSSAAFVGNQDTLTVRDNSYGLVATSGLVDVRCVSGVAVGDYVVSNKDGMAQKTDSDCGYKVISTATIDGTEYVSISLGVQACTTDMLGQRVKKLETDMDLAELDIAAVMDLATKACAMAGTSNATSDETKEKVDHVVDAVDKIQGEMNSTREDFDKSKVELNDAILAAEVTSDQAALVAKDALAKAGEIEKTVAPIDTWKDPESENVGAEYFYNYIENGLATKGEMLTVSKLEEENKLLIEKNAESYQQIISSVDKYSVGAHSQAYGLTLQQANAILKEGMIYIPIADETFFEEYVYDVDEEGNKKIYKKPFTPTTYYYEWKKIELFVDEVSIGYHYMWDDRNGKVGKLAQPPASSDFDYWYPNVDVIAEGYEQYKPKTLYMKRETTDDSDNAIIEWVEVATLSGNVNNRISSMIRQDVDSITVELVNTCGSVTGFGTWIEDTKTATQQLSTWKTSEEEKMAVVRTEATEDGSQVIIGALLLDADGELTESATLRLAVAKDEDGNPTSDLKIKADSIQFTAEDYKIMADNIALEGLVTMTDLENAGATTINGSNITTGSIQSANYTESEGAEGMKLNLATGVWDSPNFKVASNGSVKATGVDIEGTIKAQNGQIGPLKVEDGIVEMSLSMTNLACGYDEEVTNSDYPTKGYFIVPSASIGYWAGTTYDGQEIGCLIPGKTYTVQIDITPDGMMERLDAYVLSGAKFVCGIPLNADKLSERQTIKHTFVFNGYYSEAPDEPKSPTDAAIQLYRFPAPSSDPNPITIHRIKIEEGEIATGWDVLSSEAYGSTMSWQMLPDKCVWWNQNTSEQNPLMRLDEEGLYVKGEVESQKGCIGDIYIQESGLCGHVDDSPSWLLNNQGLYMPNSRSMLQVGNFSLYNEENTEGSLTTYFKSNGSFKIQASSGAYIALDDQTGNESQEIYVTLYYACGVGGRANTCIYAQADKAPYYDLTVQVNCKRYDINADSGNEYNVQTNTVILTIKANEERSTEQFAFGTSSPYFAVYNTTTNQWNTVQPDYDGVYRKVTYYSKKYIQNRSATDIKVEGNLIPSQTQKYDLGLSDCCWNVIYSKDGTVSVSDGNKKNTVQSLEGSYDLIFDSLKPVSYKFNENTSNRTHIGFIAQDVKHAVELSGLTTQDFAGYCEWEDGNGEIGCGLRYGEFVSLNTWQIQKLKSRVFELEAKLNELIEKNN